MANAQEIEGLREVLGQIIDSLELRVQDALDVGRFDVNDEEVEDVLLGAFGDLAWELWL